MKKIIGAFIVLTIFISVALFAEFKLSKSVNDMLIDIKQLTENLQNENWEQVDTEFDSLVNKWEENGKNFGIIIEHNEIDQLTIALYKAKTYANFREKEEALAEFKQFEFMVDHIPKIHKIELRNIL